MNLEDAKVFAEQIIQGAERADFYGFKLSSPGERELNLARAFLSFYCKTPETKVLRERVKTGMDDIWEYIRILENNVRAARETIRALDNR